MTATSQRADFLVEIGTEELPPKALLNLAQAFLAGVRKGLDEAGVTYEGARFYATPRRLAVYIDKLVCYQAESVQERRGPALTAAFDGNGLPTQAAKGFARSCGVEVDQLDRLETPKGAWLVHRSVVPGRASAELLPKVVSKALEELPIPKRMRWGAGDSQFVRPVHWVVMLLGENVVPGEILGVTAGRETRGHRFMHGKPLYLASPAAYMPLLETEGKVVADFTARKEAVRGQVREAAVEAGGAARIDEALLDEVTALVEWPVAVRGNFDKRFLELPDEVLVATMEGHQRYFPVVGQQGRLLPCFVTVANIESSNPEYIQQGNERVVRPRLEDAMFFFERDLATPLERHLETLKGVVFQKQLGTVADKVERVAALATFVAKALDANSAVVKDTARAAQLAKCDLMTQMVGEFPELQGTMGREYARRQKESEAVATALFEQYLPRFAGDALPGSVPGIAVAVADKLDTLCGIFAVGMPPTGDKDPFALRRAALGILRILIEKKTPLDLRQLLEQAIEPFRAKLKKVSPDLATQVYDFMMERLRSYYLDAGIKPGEFEAVLQRQPSKPADFDARVRAVAHFMKLPQAESLSAANKRISNILRQAAAAAPDRVDAKLLKEAAESRLAEEINSIGRRVEPLFDRGEYAEALSQLAGLKDAVDNFFDNVMVMVDDAQLRQNRLALLQQLQQLFLRVADFARI